MYPFENVLDELDVSTLESIPDGKGGGKVLSR
jgi:hypothetical protein